MPFITPLKLELLNEESVFPWITLAPFVYQDPDTLEEYTVPANFRTDGPSLPVKLLAAIPIAGQAMIIESFATGIFKGFKQGVLHDWARRMINGRRPMPAASAHLLFKKALTEYNYPPAIIDAYYAAVVAFNSTDD